MNSTRHRHARLPVRTFRIIGALLTSLALAVGLGTGTVSAATAHHATAPHMVRPNYIVGNSYNYIRPVADPNSPNGCVDDSNYGLREWPCNGENFQIWDFDGQTNAQNTDYIQNANTKFCLDDSSLGLRAITCNGLSYQEWTTYANDWGTDHVTWVLQNLATQNCLDESAQYGLRMWTCNQQVFQNMALSAA